MSLPNILIIGQPFNRDSGGGITLTNLFKGWDKNKLAVACSAHLLTENIDSSFCNNYYQLGHKEIKWIAPFNLIQNTHYSGKINFGDYKINKTKNISTIIRKGAITNYFMPFLKYTGLFHFVFRIDLSPDFKNWLQSFNPDIIYIQATSRADILFCQKVHNHLKKPFIFHMMDDWPSTILNKGPFNQHWYKLIDTELRILLNKASVRMSISDYMSREYKKRYGLNFLTFANPIDIPFWGKYQRTDYILNDNPVILYAGRVGVGVDASLEIAAKAIRKINNELKINIKFVLQTQKTIRWIYKYNFVHHQNFVSYNELPKIFSEADILLLPYDFSAKSLRFIQFSMPTKAPEYMISGSPIIVFAPETSAIVKYCKKYECAIVSSKNNIDELKKSIKLLIQDKETRQRIARNAIAIAENNNDSRVVIAEFKKIICSLNT